MIWFDEEKTTKQRKKCMRSHGLFSPTFVRFCMKVGGGSGLRRVALEWGKGSLGTRFKEIVKRMKKILKRTKKSRPNVKFSLYLKAGLASRNIVHLQKNHSSYVVSAPASIFFIVYVKPIRSLLIQRTPAGSSFRLFAWTFYSHFEKKGNGK